jgi:hypothetical protein
MRVILVLLPAVLLLIEFGGRPFDRPATIRKLGTRPFTRIKEEDKRRLIEDFLAQSP